MTRKLLAALALLIAVPALCTPIGISAPTATKTNVATTDPTVSNDSSQGYVAGSVWTNTLTGARWFLIDPTAGAAIWVQQGNTSCLGYVSGRTYHVPASRLSGLTVTANTLYAAPLVICQRVTINGLGFRTTTGATGNVKLAIYTNASGTPGTLLAVSPAQSTANGAVYTLTLSSNITVPPGLYWLAALFDAAPTVTSTDPADHSLNAMMGAPATSAYSSTPVGGVTASNAYTSGFPTTFPTPTLTPNLAMPLVGFQVN